MFLSVFCIALVATAVTAGDDHKTEGVGTPENPKVTTSKQTLGDGTVVKTTTSSSSFSTSSHKETSSSSSSSSNEDAKKKKPLGSHSFASSSMHKTTETHEEKKGGFSLGNKFSESLGSLKGTIQRTTSGLKDKFHKGNKE